MKDKTKKSTPIMSGFTDETNTIKVSDETQKSSTTEDLKGKSEEPTESFVKSALNRQGSVNYRNAAWKPTPPARQSSLLSMNSNSSGHFSHPASPAPSSPISKSPTDQQAYLESQFIEIYNILKNCLVDEDILLKIKN